MCEKIKMCGLWHAHVEVSAHNDNGTCPCLECFGGGCHKCKTYRDLVEEIICVTEQTRCQKCQGYTR